MTNMQSGHEWNGLPGVGSLQSGRLSLEFELHRIQSLVLMSILWVVINVINVHTHTGRLPSGCLADLSFREKIRTPTQ